MIESAINNKEEKITELFRYIWNFINRERKKEVFILLTLSIAAMVIEVISISSAIPFLTLLSGQGEVKNLPKILLIILKENKIYEKDQILLILTIIFLTAVLMSAAFRVLLLSCGANLAAKIGNDFSKKIYNNIINQKYEIIITQDSSDHISTITSKVGNLVYNAILPIITLISSVVLLISILGTLVIIDPLIIISVGSIFLTIYFIIMRNTRNNLIENGRQISLSNTATIKIIQESIGGIRDIIVDNTQKYYYDLYKISDWNLRNSSCKNLVIGGSPKYYIEAVGITIIVIVAVYLQISSDEKNVIIPILGAMALGTQKMLPIVQQIFNSWSNIESGKIASFQAIEFLKSKSLTEDKYKSINRIEILFDKTLELKDIVFSYKSEEKIILKKINLKIEKGSYVGIMGESGAGKSTLMDIILRLLTPSEGALMVDNLKITNFNEKEYQKNITHVSQNIYITNNTVLENIAFGESKNNININYVIECAQIAQIDESINKWKNKYNTIIGERGARLSGGQKQRIGIARALYKNKKIIILDEATSALDIETEKKLMDSLKKTRPYLTIIHVAHRFESLQNCDILYNIEDGILTKKDINYSNNLMN